MRGGTVTTAEGAPRAAETCSRLVAAPLGPVPRRERRGLASSTPTATLRSRLDADAEGRREEWLGVALAWSMPRRSVSHTFALGAGARTIVSIVAASPLLTRSELARWSPLSSGVPRTRGLTRRSDLPLFRSCLDITGCYNKMREVMGVTI